MTRYAFFHIPRAFPLCLTGRENASIIGANPRYGRSAEPVPLSHSVSRERDGAPDDTQSRSAAARDVAAALHSVGMGGIAAFALRAFRPLGWVSGQALWATQPFLAALGIGARKSPLSALLDVETVAGLLEREDGIDELLYHLDAPEPAPAERSGRG
jgi:hypothetical protein